MEYLTLVIAAVAFMLLVTLIGMTLSYLTVCKDMIQTRGFYERSALKELENFDRVYNELSNAQSKINNQAIELKREREYQSTMVENLADKYGLRAWTYNLLAESQTIALQVTVSARTLHQFKDPDQMAECILDMFRLRSEEAFNLVMGDQRGK
jgi:hypothetical protein